MDETILSISHGEVTAGVVIKRGRCIAAAPVYAKMVGLKLEQILTIIKTNGWYLSHVP